VEIMMRDARTRLPFILLLCATPVSLLTTASAQAPLLTPNDADIPKPVPVEVSVAGAANPNIARFLNVRTAVAPSLSPDGTRVAFRTNTTGSPQLWVVDSQGGWPDQLTFGGESVTFHEWSPAGDWIVYGTDREGNEREGYYLITPDGKKERALLTPSDAFRVFGGFTRDGRRIAYATTERNGRDFDIHLIDVASGDDREVFRGRMGLQAVSWRPDAGAVILSEARGEDANDVYLLDVGSGRVDTLFKPAVASRYDNFSWTPDGKGFYFVTNQDREFAALAHFDFATRTQRAIDAPAGDVEQASLARSGQFLAWVTSEDGYSRLRIRNLKTGDDVAPPSLPRARFSVEWADAAPVAAITVSGPQIPGDVWTWNAISGVLYRATRSATAGLDLTTMVVPTHHSFRAQDGTMIHGLLYQPQDLAPRTRAPVLLAVHGGPTAQATPRFNAAHQYLLTRGIAIFDFNYRGSTGYGKTFARLNDRRLRENELNDLRDAVAWLRRQPQLDGSGVGIMGGSYGGYLTMAALARLPDLFAGGVAFVGVSNWVTALEGASPELKASDRIEYGDITSTDDREFFKFMSPITHVAKVRAPVMVIHGANDPRDPVTESDQFVRGIREHGGNVEYLRFPDEGHGIRRLSNQIVAYRRIAAFLERTLVTRP
jgi:dipeptidyl aminopeptidase/acylaminoacyl peptidase